MAEQQVYIHTKTCVQHDCSTETRKHTRTHTHHAQHLNAMTLFAAPLKASGMISGRDILEYGDQNAERGALVTFFSLFCLAAR